MKFAKIFELPDDNQVVVMKSPVNENDLYPLEFYTYISGIKFNLTAELESQTELDNAFEAYDIEAAKIFRDNVMKMACQNSNN